MNNLSVIAIYMPFIVGTILIMVSMMGKDLSRQVMRDYLLFCTSLLGWQTTESLFYVFNQPDMMEKVYDIRIIFVSLSATFVVRVIVGFYKLNKKMPVWATYAIFAVPVATAVIAFTGLSSQLMAPGFEVTSVYPLNVATFSEGAWEDVISIFGNLMVLTAGTMVMMMHYRLPKAYRTPSISFMFALLSYAAGYALELITNSTLDYIMLGCSISNLAIYFVVAKNVRGDYLSIARREIFNYLDEAIFILDEKNRIVDVNKAAKDWLKVMGKESIFVSFNGMIDSLEQEELLETSSGENEGSVEIKLTHTDIPLVYEMNEIEMYNSVNEVKGKFVTLEDVTRNSLFIDRLEIDAGMDPLTGLQNRYTYEELIVSLDKEEHLPISVIVGDVNSLKFINDNYGHMAGDSLLSAVGDVIRSCCPETGYAARIGGDEFVIMVPRCNEDEAQAIMEKIRNNLDAINSLPFQVKMALGSVTKTTMEGSLKSQVNEADKVMYFNKTRIKEAGG